MTTGDRKFMLSYSFFPFLYFLSSCSARLNAPCGRGMPFTLITSHCFFHLQFSEVSYVSLGKSKIKFLNAKKKKRKKKRILRFFTTQIMVHQRKQRIHSGQGLSGSLMHRDPSHVGLICLVMERKIRSCI